MPDMASKLTKLHNTIGTSALGLRSPPSTATGTLSTPSTAGLGPADQHKVLYIVVHRSRNISGADSLQAVEFLFTIHVISPDLGRFFL